MNFKFKFFIMFINFVLDLSPTSVIITTIVSFHWGKCLFHLYLAHMERIALKFGSYSTTWYILNYYTKEEFRSFKEVSEVSVIYHIYEIFYGASITVAVLMFEVFELAWQLSDLHKLKFRLQEESGVSVLYLAILRTAHLIVYFPLNALKLRVTQQAFGEFLLWIILFYLRDLLLILIFTIPAFHLIRYFNRNIVHLIWAVFAVFSIANFLINFNNIFTSLEPLEDGLLRKKLEEILPQIGFSINDVYHSEEEVNEKVYFNNKWIRKALVITGTLPLNTNLSLINDKNAGTQFTNDELIALILYKIGESSKGYNYSTLMSTQVHLFSLMLICWHLSQKKYIFNMAGFNKTKPAIANMLVVSYFVVLPYWTFMYSIWKSIYEFTQLTEAQFVVSHFSLQKSLVNALVKIYKLNKEFPIHDYWYAIFNGYRRPLSSLVLSLTPVASEESQLFFNF